MNQPISTLMQREVQTVHIDDSMAVVEALLDKAQLSWLPVKDDSGTVVGAISTADLLHFHAQERDDQTVKAWQWCHYKPLLVGPQTPVSQVARLMLERQVHHAVVLEDERIQGVVSALDLLRLIADPDSQQLG
jgi:CBS domain-containing protein